MLKPSFAAALCLVPSLAFADALTLNGVAADVKVAKPEQGTLNAPITIEVQGNKLELAGGQPITWSAKENVVKTASLAKETPVKIAGQDFVLAAGSAIELSWKGQGKSLVPNLLWAKLAKDSEVKLEGRAPLTAKATDGKRDIRFFPDRVAEFALAKEAQLGPVKAPALTQLEGQGSPTNVTLKSSAGLQVTVIGQALQPRAAGVDGEKLKYIELNGPMTLGGKQVSIARVSFKDDGSIDYATVGAKDANGLKAGTKLTVNADGTFAEKK